MFNTRTNILVLGILSACLLSSCEKEIILKSNNFKPSIVLNSIFTSDSTWTLSLTTSRNLLDENSKILPITDASVVISENNGQTVCLLKHMGEGIYKSADCFGYPEKQYSITISSPIYGQAEASSRIPSPALITDVKLIHLENEETKIDFNIQDNSTSNNYFIWSLVDIPEKVAEDQPNSPAVNLDVTKWVSEISKNLTSIKINNSTSVLSAEESINSPIIKSSVITRNDLLLINDNPNDPPSPSNPKMVTYLRVMTVSDELYKYYKSIENYIQYKDKNTSAYESEFIYSNVKGGIGVFAGYSVQYLPLKK